jgi:hypothetical protein
MECWADKSGGKLTVVEFPITDQSFQRLYSAGLGADLRFCLFSISCFRIGNHALV